MTRGAASAATAASVCRPTTQHAGCRGAGAAGRACGPGPTPCRRRAGCGVGGVDGSDISPPPRLGRRCAGSRGARCMSSWWRAAWRRPCRPARKTTWSARSRMSGLADITTVVRPARASVSRAAMRASVWASTALVGSTSTSVSASVSSARVSARRCRWPPENARPRSSTSLSRPSGSASSTSSPLATDSAREDRRVVVVAPRVELVAQRAGEEAGVGLATRRSAAAARRAGASARRVPLRRPRSPRRRTGRAGRPGRPSPPGRAETTTVKRPGSMPTPLRGSTSGTPAAARGGGASSGRRTWSGRTAGSGRACPRRCARGWPGRPSRSPCAAG